MEKIKIKVINGIILFKANIDGIEGNLILDTGSVKSTFNLNYFQNHHSCVIQEKDVCVVKNGQTITQKYKVGNIVIDKLSFNDYEYHNYSASVLDLNYVEKPLSSMDNAIKVLGTLGMDFISKHLITINYKEQYLTIDSNEKIEGRKYN